ncbi:MAG TPA: hypothetical protein VFI53_18300 [Myxococcaceae bacterium]|nr:hypothetical protein [Myxococcaceae bacterium]
MSPSPRGTGLARALPWLAGLGMVVGLLPMAPLATLAPALVFEHLPVFLLLMLLGVSAAQQAREGESTEILVGAVLGGLVAALIPMLWVAGLALFSIGAWAWVFYVQMPPILWLAGSGGATVGAAIGWIARRRRTRRFRA